MKMPPELLAKKYDGLSLVAINLEGDRFSSRRLLWPGRRKISGHWYSSGVLTSRFFALLVFEGRILFLAEGRVFDVTSEQWTAATRRNGLVRNEFLLLNGTEQVYRAEYLELTRSSVEDMDPHFFVQVVGWLRTPASKGYLIDFWCPVEKSNDQ